MDVICAGMVRSGSTWQYLVVSDLVESRGLGKRQGFIDRYEPPIAAEGWRVLKAHAPQPFDPATVKAVYSYRNLPDVVRSMLRVYGETFETVLSNGRVRAVLTSHLYWSLRPGVLVQRYEDISRRPAQAVGELAEHLGIKLVDFEDLALADKYSRERNRQRCPESGFDPDTLLHWNHIGDSSDPLTAVQLQMLDAMCGLYRREKS